MPSKRSTPLKGGADAAHPPPNQYQSCVQNVNNKIYSECKGQKEKCDIVVHCTEKGTKKLPFDLEEADKPGYRKESGKSMKCAKQFVGSSPEYQKRFDDCQKYKPPPGSKKSATKSKKPTSVRATKKK